MMAQKTKETIIASVIKPKQIITQNVLNTPANQVILKQVKLPHVSTLRTHFIETEEDYEPIFVPNNFSF